MSGTLFGVGAGTGDPELLTLKGARILREVDVVVCPNSGRSSALAPVIDMLDIADKVQYVTFTMSTDAAVREHAHLAAFQKIKQLLDTPADVAFLTLGDPSLYSTFTPIQEKALYAGYDVVTVPGIIAPCAAAACANQALAVGDEPLTIIPALKEQEFPPTALALMKVKFNYPEIVAQLEATDRMGGAYLATKIGMKGEKIERSLRSAEKPRSYFSTIIVPENLTRKDW